MTKLKPVTARSDLELNDDDAVIDAKHDKSEVKKAADQNVERISELQRVFYAAARHALLIILQGRDAAGKDGTVRTVFSAVNPQGCTVTSFKQPTPLEQSHDYLWRAHAAVPARGMIGIFNRSHYEDVLVPRVHDEISKSECETRYRQIADFERMLAEQGVIILKFMLHISRDEQKKRLEKRLTQPNKRWKFRAGDLDDRRRWGAFTDAYRDMLEATSTKWAPWYVVPSDDKKVRNWLVSQTIADTLESLELRYPEPEEGIDQITID
jgi:PPK2 family polyphosphate:nucleotide phosphotransferase